MPISLGSGPKRKEGVKANGRNSWQWQMSSVNCRWGDRRGGEDLRNKLSGGGDGVSKSGEEGHERKEKKGGDSDGRG